MQLGPGRLLALADGIFAIAMTLLVFELRIPTHAATSDELWRSLVALWPKLASFAVSFLTLGYSWIGHHNQYAVIRRVNRPFLWINILFFLFIVLVPFSSVLLGEYPFERISIIAFSTNLICAGLTLAWHWSYAAGRGKLVEDGLEPSFVAQTRRRVLIAPVAYVIVIAISFIDVRIAAGAGALVPLIFIIPGRVDRYWAKE